MFGPVQLLPGATLPAGWLASIRAQLIRQPEDKKTKQNKTKRKKYAKNSVRHGRRSVSYFPHFCGRRGTVKKMIIIIKKKKKKKKKKREFNAHRLNKKDESRTKHWSQNPQNPVETRWNPSNPHLSRCAFNLAPNGHKFHIAVIYFYYYYYCYYYYLFIYLFFYYYYFLIVQFCRWLSARWNRTPVTIVDLLIIVRWLSAAGLRHLNSSDCVMFWLLFDWLSADGCLTLWNDDLLNRIRSIIGG